jgi:very-short-patch-repair endonuclease
MSPAEARIWNLLRTEPLRDWHFRRQVPLGAYYADFASHAARLVIEVDGDTHGSAAARQHDAHRDAFIAGQGYQTLRISNYDVMNNLDGVGEHLMRVLAAAPTRPASRATLPTRGRENGARATDAGKEAQ